MSRRAALLQSELTADEVERLNTFLGHGHGELGDFNMLDGFISAVALIPEPLLPACWYPHIFGGPNQEEVERRVAAAEADGILALITRHWSRVVRRLARGQPWEICVYDEFMLDPAFRWAMGFREGMLYTEEFWEGLTTRERYLEVTAAVHRFYRHPLVFGPDLQPQVEFEEYVDRTWELVVGVNRMYEELRAG